MPDQPTQPLTDTDLEEIAARLNDATPGPWHKDDGEFGCVTIGDYGWTTPRGANAPEYDVDSPQGHADAEFIAHARTDVPRLLAEVDRLRAELAGARQDVEDAEVAGAQMECERDALAAELESVQDARAAETDAYIEQLRAIPGWCRACPPGCVSCLGPDCECYEHPVLGQDGGEHHG